MKRFRGGLVFKAHRRVHHSTLGLRVIKKKKHAGAISQVALPRWVEHHEGAGRLRENVLITRLVWSQTKTPCGGCCSTRIPVSLAHCTFLNRLSVCAPTLAAPRTSRVGAPCSTYQPAITTLPRLRRIPPLPCSDSISGTVLWPQTGVLMLVVNVWMLGVLNLRTTTLQTCAAVPRRVRI